MTVCEQCGEIEMNSIGNLCRDCEWENEELFDDDEFEEKALEREYQISLECKCGAVGFDEKGLFLVADCVCGAY